MPLPCALPGWPAADEECLLQKMREEIRAEVGVKLLGQCVCIVLEFLQ